MSKKRSLSLVESESSTIKLEGVDKQGRQRVATLKATIIGADEDLPESSADEPDPFDRRSLSKHGLIFPPYDLPRLVDLKEQSTELGQCVQTMVTNTVGFGWTLREVPMTEEQRERNHDLIVQEKAKLNALLRSLHPTHSFTRLRKQAKDDQHSCGNGYLELIESPKTGQLLGVNHVRGHLVRLTAKDKKPTKVYVPRARPDLDFQVDPVPMLHRFRKFVMMRMSTPIFFKEAGDPRCLDKYTGEYADPKDPNAIKPGRRASSVIHFSNYSAVTPYGLPLWIGNLFSILGSRQAEEVNYGTLSNNAIPSMFVIVENGALTEKSIERLTEWTQEQIQKSVNRSKFLLLEGEVLEEGGPNPANFRIRVEPLKALQEKDELYQEYDSNNRDKVRQAFRLPPIFVGRCHSEDTEYLTERGWKLYSDIGESERLATVNPATGAVEYQAQTARHEYDYQGDHLLHLRNRGIDALVTPNHRMWTRPTVAGARAEKPWDFVQAFDLHLLRGGNGGRLEIPVSASWVGEELEKFTVPRNDGEASWDPSKPTKNRTRDSARWQDREGWNVEGDVFIRFIGYFVSEGSTTDTPGPISLSQNKGHVADRMIEAVKGIGFDPSITEGRPDQLNISFCHVGLWAWLREFCGAGSSNKRLPLFVLGASQRQLEILLDAMVDGDGHLPQLGSDGSFTYSTTSKILNDQLHEICLKLGIAMTSRLVNREDLGWKDIWCSYGHYDQRHLLHPKHQIDLVPYDGKVSCFTVPNGLLVTRRNGRVLISGNSDDYTRATADTSRDIADEQVFAPERADDDFLVNRFILQRWGARFHIFRSNNPNITDDIELIRLMAIAERSGAMTPRRADRIVRDVFGEDIGPMPQGIELDKPFSITFAEAQQGAGGTAPAPGQGSVDAARRMIDGLVNLRKRIEAEIEERVYLELED